MHEGNELQLYEVGKRIQSNLVSTTDCIYPFKFCSMVDVRLAISY
jgi:hypothetical protein